MDEKRSFDEIYDLMKTRSEVGSECIYIVKIDHICMASTTIIDKNMVTQNMKDGHLERECCACQSHVTEDSSHF